VSPGEQGSESAPLAGRRAWRWQALPSPRPLYNLDKLHARQNAPIVICEGEKAADAAAELLPDYVSTTMLNGAQSPHKTDWAPLKGRKVLLWADNDTPGLACMAKVAELTKRTGAVQIEVINLQAFAKAPGRAENGAATLTPAEPLPPKWDAADALARGWTSDHIQLLRAAPGFCSEVEDTKPSNRKAVRPPCSVSRRVCGEGRIFCSAGGRPTTVLRR